MEKPPQPLRRWLSKQPHPSMVLAEYSDGSEKKVRLGVARSKFRDAEEALQGAVSCDALDEHGDVLRAWHAGDGDEPAKKEKTTKDEQAQLMVSLARVLAEVADQAVARYSSIVQLSFEQNAKLLGLISGRLQAIERLYHSSLIAQAEALAQDQADAAEQQDPNAPLVAQVLAQALGSGLSNGAQEKG